MDGKGCLGMRLIDVDLFMQNVRKELNCDERCCECVHCDLCEIYKMTLKQPTAFDLESVIEQLQTELNLADKEKERSTRENPLQFDEAKGYSHGMSVALEILKSAANATNGKNGG